MSLVKKILISLVGLLSLTLVVSLTIYFISDGPISAVNKQLAALREGDLVEAYALTSKEFQGATSLADFEGFAYHYTTLKNNKSAELTQKKAIDDTSIVQGIIHGQDGSTLPIEYLLVKEEGTWKILGLQLDPQGVSSEESAASKSDKTLTQEFNNVDSQYTIKYPSSWEYEKASDGTYIFSGKRGSASYLSTVNIQTVLSKKLGGTFSTVSDFINDIKSQAKSQSENVQFLRSGSLTITEKNGEKDRAQYVIFTYKYKGKVFKQWQIVVLRHDEQVFYAWAYTSPVEYYENDKTVAADMLQSWVIY